jgi:hypothetical protein
MKNITNELLVLESEEQLDINEKYKLNIIVPIIWSLIIFIGVIGLFSF